MERRGREERKKRGKERGRRSRGQKEKVQKAGRRGKEIERDMRQALPKHSVVHQRCTLAQSLEEDSTEPSVYAILLRGQNRIQ